MARSCWPCCFFCAGGNYHTRKGETETSVTTKEINDLAEKELQKWRNDRHYDLFDGYKKAFLEAHPEYADKKNGSRQPTTATETAQNDPW